MARNLNDVIAALPPKRRAKVEQRAGELVGTLVPESISFSHAFLQKLFDSGSRRNRFISKSVRLRTQ